MAKLRKIQAYYSDDPVILRRQVQELERVLEQFADETNRELQVLRDQIAELQA